MKISVETTVSAPIGQVWRAYTAPEDIKQWNAASNDWHTTAATVDLRVGGAFCSRMEAKDGSVGFDFAGTYTEIIEHQRIAYSFGDRTAQVEFAEVPDGVRVCVTFDSEPTHSIEQQRAGWQAILDNFTRHVERGQHPMKTAAAIGVQAPTILLPKPGIDLHKWAVIACDQFTSEPEYWQQVAETVGDAPSTYHITLPEIYLDTPEEGRRVQQIRAHMQDYLDRDLFIEHEGFILVERTVAGKVRHGIMLALDLEQYDYNKGSTSLIRATEGTILERIPPRVRIRSGAPLELPHILVLIDDPGRTVIEPLVAARAELPKLYDCELMLGSGHLRGYSAADPAREAQVIAALARLADPTLFAAKYSLDPGRAVLLFAMGDGNHSLATAKAIWEQIKAQEGMIDHPARYALVEVENIHDTGLEFEPIHRVLFDVQDDFVAALGRFYDRCHIVPCATAAAMVKLVDQEEHPEHAFGVVTPAGFSVAFVGNPATNLPVGTLQNFLDAWGKGLVSGQGSGFGKIDYVHGEDVTVRLGSQPGNMGFYLPAIHKGDFFKTVILDGALPRKTFSMGEAKEKRFYLEARRIV